MGESAILQDREGAAAMDAEVEVKVWLRLLTCATLIEREIRSGLSQDFNSTLPRFDALAQLVRAEATGEVMTMGELSRRMMVSNGNVTGLIDRLVDEGLVERLPAPKDRRTQMIKLTAKGHRHFAEMAPIHHGWVKDLLADVPRQEMTQLFSLLGKVKQSVTRHQNT